MCGEKYNLLHWFPARSSKRSETLFKSLLFWLPGEVSWLPRYFTKGLAELIGFSQSNQNSLYLLRLFYSDNEIITVFLLTNHFLPRVHPYPQQKFASFSCFKSAWHYAVIPCCQKHSFGHLKAK